MNKTLGWSAAVAVKAMRKNASQQVAEVAKTFGDFCSGVPKLQASFATAVTIEQQFITSP
jgi:hypothetical protein